MKISFKRTDDGEVLNEWKLLPSQERLWKSPKKVILFSGGFGMGKSLILTLKAIDLALKYPNNYILMGRQTYPELRDTLWKEFPGICPEHLIKDILKSEMRIILINNSEIIFRHLDKIADKEIRSLNLGAAFIDQAEDLPKPVFQAIKGRLRRDGIADGDRKMYMTMNPELTWHFAEFKQNPRPEYELIEGSTLENKENLPPEYVADLLSYPEDYKRQYVYGIWDESLLSSNAVFPQEYMVRLQMTVMSSLKEIRGVPLSRVYRDFISGHRYQIGVDLCEGAEAETDKKDKASIVVVDLTVLEEVAHWSGQVSPDVVADYAAEMARVYQDSRSLCEVVPEMNSIGTAFVNAMKVHNDISLYRREEFDRSTGKKMKKLGFRTTRSSKPLLIAYFKKLMRLGSPKIRTKETIEEMKTFIHTPDARKQGMGAKTGFHDDRLMATFLAFFQKETAGMAGILHKNFETGTMRVEIEPTFIMVKGLARIRDQKAVKPMLSWKT